MCSKVMPWKPVALLLLLFSCAYCRGNYHDGWSRKDYPVEEFTSGLEAGPLDTEWGHTFAVTVRTSRREFADSTAAVAITFYGTRATSDSYLLQRGFARGATDTVRLTLNREIGELERVALRTNSTDGWLCAALHIDVGPTTYFFHAPSVFLDYPDSALADRQWDGGAHGVAFTADPYGALHELYEPQAPTGRAGGDSGGGVEGGRGQGRRGADESAGAQGRGAAAAAVWADEAEPAGALGAAAAYEGLLGAEVLVLAVVDRADNFRDPGDYAEEMRPYADRDP